MQDLLLFRLLRARAWDDARLPALLSDFARLPGLQRAPYFGLLVGLLDVPELGAHLRAPALAALEGADGPKAVEKAVEALSAEDDALRTAGLHVLRSTAGRSPGRWAHVLFAKDPRVRRAALEGTSPWPELETFLLADGELRELVRARKPKVEAFSASALVELAAKGALPVAEARALLAADPRWVEPWSRGTRARALDVCTRYLESALGEKGPDEALVAGTADELEGLLALFWDEDATEARALLLAVAHAMRRMPAEPRFAAAVLHLARSRGRWPEGALAALVCAWPRVLGAPWLERPALRSALAILHTHTPLPRRDDAELRAITSLSLFSHADGGLDPWALAAVLRLAAANPLVRVVEWLGADPVREAFERRPAESLALLLLDDDVGRKKLFTLPRGLRLLSDPARERLLADFAREAAVAQLPFLLEIDGGEDALLSPAQGDGWVRLLSRLLEEGVPHDRIDTLAALAAQRLSAAQLGALVRRWLADPMLPGKALGLAVTARGAAALSSDAWIELALGTAERLPLLLAQVARHTAFPYGKEVSLARALVDHADPEVRAWARERVALPEEATRGAAPPPEALLEVVATCPHAELAPKCATFLSVGGSGVAEALARRPAPPGPVVLACVALLASADAPDATDAELARFGSDDPAFLSELDLAMVAHLSHARAALSPLGHAWLWRWDRHALAWLDGAVVPRTWGVEGPIGAASLAQSLRAAMELRSVVLRADTLFALGNAVSLLAVRDRPRLHELVGAPLVGHLVDLLSTPMGAGAADALVALHRAGCAKELLAAEAPRARTALVDAPEAVRARAASWVEATDLPAAPVRRAAGPEPEASVLARLRAATDPAELLPWVLGDRARLVHEATLRLVDLGEPGVATLAEVLCGTTGPALELRPVLESVSLWPDGAALRRVRALLSDDARAPELRFRVALALAERDGVGEAERDELLAVLLRAIGAPLVEASWFEADDWARASRWVDGDRLALGVATAAHPHAYMRAVERILAMPPSPAADGALLAFLEQGTKRMGALRRRAADVLHARPERRTWDAFPLVLEQRMEQVKEESTLLAGAPDDVVSLATRAIVFAAPNLAKEPAAIHHLAAPGIDPFVREDAYAWLLDHAAVDGVRGKAVAGLGKGPWRARRVRAIAEAFAWGVERGRELLGRTYKVQMTGGKGLGYTRLREHRVFVSPMPILRGDRYGRDVVEGLVLHELGHHIWHKGPGPETVWAEAQKEGISGLLNLVADEHLERNLRAIDPDYGDRLKRLATYAFSHYVREMQVADLLRALGASALAVLSDTQMGVARQSHSVVVESGALLKTMERVGLAFPRFVRALRMGLGDRHGDPDVASALELFGARFRKGDMQSLMDVTRDLRARFGWQVQLVEKLGTHEAMEEGEEDGSWWGISDDEVQREVQRVLDPKERKKTDDPGKPGGRPWINVQPKVEFDRITTVQRLTQDPTEHARYVRMVDRHAQTLRRYLEELGLGMDPERMRTAGTRLDPSRLRALVLRGDPRVLVSRKRVEKADVFLGIVVDCSGSMNAGDLMERAKRFAVLLSEAARPLRGIDVRIFGFTDKVIYDAGDARSCAAHALRPGGGNNDAAALFHAAGVANQSRRRARVLVMISDGLPTECSVDALKNLVKQLGARERIVCAQVAVRPITEICFPHYVLVQDDDVQVAVRRFGEIVVRLVAGAMGG